MVTAATACGGDDGVSSSTAGAPDTTVAGSQSTTPVASTDGGGGGTGWATDVVAEEMCTFAEPAEVEGIVGRALADVPTGSFSVDVATCFYNFDPDSTISTDSVVVRVWPAAEWGDRTPQEAYDYRYEINTEPAGIAVTAVGGLGAEAHLMEIDDLVWVMVLTDGRLFEVQSSTVTPEQLVEIAGLFADDL